LIRLNISGWTLPCLHFQIDDKQGTVAKQMGSDHNGTKLSALGGPATGGSLRDTPWIRPCRLVREIPLANSPAKNPRYQALRIKLCRLT